MLASSDSFYIVTSFLPFVIFLGFAHFLTRRASSRMQTQQQPLLDKLEGIRAELERLRKTMERDDDGFGFRS
ncbi:MAG: hypothetical protein E6G50_04085 [Actinobacteria bacterium]|nr:MAG: hypothetical protein E6G50_04085 [Actinomycetota bacterium]